MNPDACALCGKLMPEIEEAIDAGWLPSFWDGEAEDGPVCPDCETKLITDDDGELVLCQTS